MFKKILAYALTVCLLISATVVPAYAFDEVYNIADDVVPAPVIYYTEDYYPGLLAQLRSSMTFANNRIAHGSFATMNYNPSIFYREGSVHTSLTNYTIPFNSLTPYVTADQTDVSGVYSIPRTTLLQGNMMIVYLPSTSDAYFDFQSSNIAFVQQDANANTFYINGTLTFNLRNLWSLNGSYETTSFYLASDPLAVQLLIDGKAYGDIIDVTNYNSPFTALYNGGVPTDASVTFDNLKVYYQGDTPDMVGFRVYTGSAFTDGQYNYNSGGDFVGVDVTNTVTMRFSDVPDITFVNEGGDGYAGDLSGISGLLSSINTAFQTVISRLTSSNGESWLYRLYDGFVVVKDQWYLDQNGNNVQSTEQIRFSRWLSYSLMGLKKHLADITNTFVLKSGQWYINQSGNSVQATSDMSFPRWLGFSLIGLKKTISDGFNTMTVVTDQWYLDQNGNKVKATSDLTFSRWLAYSLMGLEDSMEAEFNALFTELDSFSSYVSSTVFPWRSYNMDTHQLNTATNITGQNNLFFTAFQSIEDKLGRLAYVFGSDEDLALKDSADPSTDAFRQDFGGGASLSDIKDSAELATSVPQLMDSGFNFADGIEEIGSNNGYLAWFSAETWAALDSTGAAVAADPDYLSDYYENLRKVDEKRHWGD